MYLLIAHGIYKSLALFRHKDIQLYWQHIFKINGQFRKCQSWSFLRWQSNPTKTYESILPVCDKPYNTNNGILQKGEEVGNLRNFAFRVECKTVPIKGTTSDVGGRLSDTIIKNTTMERSVVIPMETWSRDVTQRRRHTRCKYIGKIHIDKVRVTFLTLTF